MSSLEESTDNVNSFDRVLDPNEQQIQYKKASKKQQVGISPMTPDLIHTPNVSPLKEIFYPPTSIEMSSVKLSEGNTKMQRDLKKLVDEGLKNQYQIELEHSKIRTNHGYVMFFMLTFLFSTTFQGGWALCECGQVGLVLDKKLGWNAITDDASKKQLVNMVTIATMLGPLGVAIGSQMGGSLLPKYGSRKLVIVANAISILANIVKIWESTWPIMIGRFVFGVMTGITNVCLSKTINDTVPVKNQQQYGSFVNSGFAVGMFAVTFMGLLIPLDNGQPGDVQKMINDSNWRYVFGLPILFEVYGIIILIFIIKHESIIELLRKESKDSKLLLGELKKIYTVPKTMTYKDLAIKLEGEIQVQETDPTTVCQAFTKRQHRRASCNALLFPIIYQLTGIDGILLFQTQIFLKMKRDGEFDIPVMWGVLITMFINMVAAYAYPVLSNHFRQKQALIFGHVGMTISLFAIVLFKLLHQNMMILVAINLFICFFEYGVGCIMVLHLFETNVDSIVGLGNFMLFIGVAIVSLLFPMQLDMFTESGTFTFYGIGSLIGIFYIICYVRPTNNLGFDQNGQQEIQSLSEKDKKELYWPEDYRTKPQNDYDLNKFQCEDSTSKDKDIEKHIYLE